MNETCQSYRKWVGHWSMFRFRDRKSLSFLVGCNLHHMRRQRRWPVHQSLPAWTHWTQDSMVNMWLKRQGTCSCLRVSGINFNILLKWYYIHMLIVLHFKTEASLAWFHQNTGDQNMKQLLVISDIKLEKIIFIYIRCQEQSLCAIKLTTFWKSSLPCAILSACDLCLTFQTGAKLACEIQRRGQPICCYGNTAIGNRGWGTTGHWQKKIIKQ